MNTMSANFRKTLFPLSESYDHNWIKQNSLGENVLYNLESLTEVMKFKEGMRVLDLGCGTGVSAIFLAKEFGVEVWAIDQYISPSENFRRIKEMNCEHSVFPLKLNAKELPFPPDFLMLSLPLIHICISALMKDSLRTFPSSLNREE